MNRRPLERELDHLRQATRLAATPRPPRITRPLPLTFLFCPLPQPNFRPPELDRLVSPYFIRSVEKHRPRTLGSGYELVLITSRKQLERGPGGVGGFRDGKIMLIDQRGRDVPNVASSAATGHDLEEFELFLRETDLHIDPSTNAPKWDGRR